MEIDETARKAGHIILDGVTAADLDDVDATDDAMELVFGRLLEIDAIEVLLDEEEDELELDISALMGGVMSVVRHLVDEVARRDGSSTEDVLAIVRTALDAS